MTEGLVNQDQAVLDAASPQTTPPQKMVSQDEVNYLTSKVRAETEAKAYEKAKLEVTQQMQAQAQNQGKAVSENDLPGMVDKALEKKMQDLQERQNQKMADELYQKVQKAAEEGRRSYGEDFDKSIGKINFGATPKWLPLLTTIPNAPDVMYSLGNDLNNFSKIHSLLISGQDVAAKELLDKYSSSVSENRDAEKKTKESKQPRDPLSHLKPSTTGVDSAGVMNLSQKDLNRLLRR